MGSACQYGLLVDDLVSQLPKEAGLILVHALNPYGFAWSRRTNEDNVDLNRNFRDWSQQPPSSEEYDKLHDALIPGQWEMPKLEHADKELNKLIDEMGWPTFQAVLTRGNTPNQTACFMEGIEEENLVQ